MPGFDEVLHYLIGVGEMIGGHRRGLARLDLSTTGFWRSFWAYVYALPAYVGFTYFDRAVYLASDPTAEAGAGFVIRALAGQVLAVVLSLTVVALLARPLNMSNRFAQWVIAGNWLTLPLSYAYVLAIGLTMGLGGSATTVQPALLLMWVVALFVSYRVYRMALNDDAMLAIFLIVLTFVVGLACVSIV